MKLIQNNNFTGFGRYIPQFQVVRQAAAERSYRRAMVFGGSVGLEAMEIATLVPGLEIFSYELDRKLVRFSRGYSRLGNAEFLVSSWRSIELRAPYDIIFANSVLCDHPAANGKTDLDTFKFQQFADVVTQLSQYLAPGGCMVLCNSNYSVLDITSILNLHPATGSTPFMGVTSLFDQSSKKIISCKPGLGQFPCFFSTTDLPSSDDWRRITSSVYFKDAALHAPLLDLSVHPEIARIDPYIGFEELSGGDLHGAMRYLVVVRSDQHGQGMWLEYIDGNNKRLFQGQIRY